MILTGQQIRVSCDDEVVFLFDDLTALDIQPPFPTFNELERDHFPVQELNPLLACLDQTYPPPDGVNPCLIAKANFISGGLILGYRYHHTATDNVGISAFLRSWAKHTAAAAAGTRISPHQSNAILDRSPLFPTTHSMKLEDFSSLSKSGKDFLAAPASPANVVIPCWYFSASALRALKAACGPPEPATDPWISTGDALAALLWCHSSRARQLTAVNNATSTFIMPCDVRTKLRPPLPKDTPATVFTTCTSPTRLRSFILLRRILSTGPQPPFAPRSTALTITPFVACLV